MDDRTVLEEVLAPWDDADRPGVGATVIRGAERTTVCKGMASIEHQVPLAPTSITSFASISKQFACTTVLLLEADGRISLDDDIRKHLPEVPDYGRTVTVRHLMTNSSGLRDFEGLLILAGIDAERPFSHADVMDLVKRQRCVVAPPDAEYRYCNTGFRLLAVLVERLTGRPWNLVLRDEVLVPLGMASSWVSTDAREVVRDLVTPYERAGEGAFRRAAGQLPVFAVAESGESGLFSTLDDMAVWATADKRNDRVGDAVRRLPTTHALSSGLRCHYGFGVFDEVWRGHRMVRHAGGMPGMNSEIVRFPDDELAIVCVTNQDEASPMRLVSSIAGQLLDALPDMIPAAIEPARLVDEGAGVIIDISRTGEGATASIWDWTLDLEAVDAARVRTYSTWLEMDVAAGVDGAPRASLGGAPLRLQAVADTTGLALPPDLEGRYRSDELDATYVVEPGPDGRMEVVIEGIHGRTPRGVAWPVTETLVAVGRTGAAPSMTLQVTDGGIIVHAAAVAGIVLERTPRRKVSDHRAPRKRTDSVSDGEDRTVS